MWMTIENLRSKLARHLTIGSLATTLAIGHPSTVDARPSAPRAAVAGDLDHGISLHEPSTPVAHGEPALEIDVKSLPFFIPDGGAYARRGGRRAYALRRVGAEAARPSFYLTVSRDYGPEPRLGLVRHTVDSRLGWLRAFMNEHGLISVALRSSLFAPDMQQPWPAALGIEQTQALILEMVVQLDLRDRQREPRRGVYLRVGAQQAGFGGASTWDYSRMTLDVRGYVPLSKRSVLAARFSTAAMFVFGSHGLDAPAEYALDELGPFAEQLQGGGVSSHRGYRRGGLGGTRRELAARNVADGSELQYRPVLIAGGARRWEASIELRSKLSKRLGTVLFVDMGNVARGGAVKLGALNLAAGFGLRYRTPLGLLRAEWAFRPDALQYVGKAARGGAPRACEGISDVNCRPAPTFMGSVPGAFHLAFAEPF